MNPLREACATPLDHPDLEWLRQASAAVTSFLIQDYTQLGERSIGLTATRPEMEALLREPPPEHERDFAEVLREFEAKVWPLNFRPSHPRFLAFIPGAPTFVSILGDWVCAGLNYFAGVWKEAAAATEVELVVLDWFKEFLGYPAGAQGILTGGGSEANLTALVVARERHSYEDRRRAVLYVSEQRHWSVDRAAKVVGLHPDQVRKLPSDGEQRLQASILREAIEADRQRGVLPWAVVANAGTTNTGAVDPLADLAEVCEESGLWLHVDAAYGWSAALTDEGQRLLRGIERADSITLDPHKWFGQTFEAGCLLVKDGKLLGETFCMRPEYMQDVEPREQEVNFADHGIALTRRFRALKIWLSVKVLGIGWFRRLIEHCMALAAYSQKLVEQAGVFEIVSPRRLSIVCFRYVPSPKPDDETLDRLNLALCERLRESGRAFLSTTRLGGKVALRLCFVNWRTTAADVEEVVKLLVDLGAC